jgi:O-antigen/teichoic acid export membrane protein
MTSKLEAITTSNIFQKYFKNTSWLFFERIFRMVVSLFVGVWVARYLGPEKFGILSYVQSYVAIFSVIASFGITNIVVRELINNKFTTNQLIGTSFWIKFLGALFVIMILYLTFSFTSDSETVKIYILILGSALLLQAFNIIDLYYQFLVLSKYIVMVNSIGLLLSSILKIVFILNDMSLIYFVALAIFDSFILAIGYLYIYKKHNSPINVLAWKFDTSVAKYLLKSSFPLLLSGFVVSIYMRIDQVMINYMLGNEAVGYYSAALRLSEVWYFIPTIIGASLYPTIIKSIENKSITLEKLSSLFTLLSLLSLCISTLIVIFSSEIINLLYGSTFNQSISVLSIHIVSLVFVSLSISSGRFLTAMNMEKKVFYRNLAGLGINVSFNYLLIPSYGIEGAAIATLFSWFVAGYTYDLFDKDLRYMFYLKTRALLMLDIKLIKDIVINAKK